MRSNICAAIILSAAILAGSGAIAAEWKPLGRAVASAPGKMFIDRARIATAGDGLVVAWSRFALPQPVDEAEGRYNIIEAKSRYDCAGRRFATLKRLYLLDELLVRAESVVAPKDVSIAPGSADAAIVSEVCRESGQSLDMANSSGSPTGGFMYADVQKLAGAEPPRFLAVTDAPPAPAEHSPQAAPGAAPTLRPFIIYPRIDPSQVQHPTDEVKPDPAKEADSVAVKREAAKSGVSIESSLKGLDRRAREITLATSGPRRRGAARPPLADGEPAAVVPRQEVRWGYEGTGAPANWARLRPEFAVCAHGERQSPIDIRDGIRVDLEPVRFDYKPSRFRIVDNGYTVQVKVAEGSTMTVMGRNWRLTGVEFHRPSEEIIDGRGFEMSLQLLHEDDKGNLAIIAVPVERGAEHPVVQIFWNHLPLEVNMELAPGDIIDVEKLLPQARNYYTYMGSLTTPPCSEGVLWMVLKQPQQLSGEQIAIFSRLYRNNARPIQPSNGRLIKESR